MLRWFTYILNISFYYIVIKFKYNDEKTDRQSPNIVFTISVNYYDPRRYLKVFFLGLHT